MGLDDALWREFFAETDEHLETLETLLGEARTAGLMPAGAIAAAFRAFHSLKGLTQATALSGMQRLAHHAEDLLGLVRGGQARLDVDAVSLLLEVVDRLRLMREWVMEHGTDAPPDHALAARLDSMVAAISGRPVPPPAAPPDPPPDVPPDVPLAEDSEMLALYCELLAERAADLAGLLAESPAARQAALDTAEALAHGAAIMGFEQLAADLQALGGAAQPDAAALDVVREQLALLEEMTGLAAGAMPLGQALAGQAALRAAQGLRSLHEAIAALAAVGDDPGGAAAGAIVVAAHHTSAALATAGLREAAALARLVEDQFSRNRQGELADLPALTAAAHAIIEAVMARDIAGLEDIAAADATALQTSWLARLRGEQATAPALALPEELREMLSGEQLGYLARRLAGGARAFTLLLDLAAAEVAGDLIAWLASAAEVITNRTVMIEGRSWFEFLIIADLSTQQMRDQLAALDPAQLCVRALTPLTPGGGETSAGGAVPPTAPAPVIRVRVETIDRLMDEVAELRAGLAGFGDALRDGPLADGLGQLRRQLAQMPQAIQGSLAGPLRAMLRGLTEIDDLREGLDDLHRVVWSRCMALRVVPADVVFARFPRLVRDLAQKLGKQVELEITGRDVRLDKTMADLLVDPLMHMVRNAVDHGVEPPAARAAAGKPVVARLALAAAEHGDGVVISLRDDGAGLDRAAIVARAMARGLLAPGADGGMSDRAVYDFLFRSGFSTASAVTEISGRGVGLDVVAAAVERLGGTIDITTERGRGTCFSLRLPASASLQNVLLVEAGDKLAIPERDVAGVTELSDDLVDRAGPVPMLWFEDAAIPLHSLTTLLGGPPASLRSDQPAVIVMSGSEFLALAVEQAPQRREFFLRELHPLLARLPAVGGAAVLGNGQPVLVLDVAGLFDLARRRSAVAVG